MGSKQTRPERSKFFLVDLLEVFGDRSGYQLAVVMIFALSFCLAIWLVPWPTVGVSGALAAAKAIHAWLGRGG